MPQVWVKITFLYLGSLNRARLALEKYVSASPSHPGTREDRSPASPAMYFRESCSFSKRTAFRSATILVRVVRLIIVQQCTKYNVVRCWFKNVSRSPVVRVVDVLVPRSRLMTNSHFLTTWTDAYVIQRSWRGVTRDPFSGNCLATKSTQTQHESQCWKCTNLETREE